MTHRRYRVLQCRCLVSSRGGRPPSARPLNTLRLLFIGIDLKAADVADAMRSSQVSVDQKPSSLSFVFDCGSLRLARFRSTFSETARRLGQATTSKPFRRPPGVPPLFGSRPGGTGVQPTA